MTSELLTCHRCGEEFEVNYSFKDEYQIVSGHCKCALQTMKDNLKQSNIKTLDRVIGVLNEELKPSTSKVSRQSKANR